MFRAIAIVIGILCLADCPLFAQEPARSVNPEAIEFDPPQYARGPGTEYRVEFFRADADLHADRPIRSVNLDAWARQDDGSIRVDLNETLTGVPDGTYIAALRAFSPNGPVDIGEPTQTFILARQPGSGSHADLTPRERFWTKIGFAIMGGFLLVPFLVR